MAHDELITLEDELGKNDELTRDDIRAISEWMEERAGLPRISDLKIAFFLHSCYFKLEPTKVCIEKYFTIKRECPEVFAERRCVDIRPTFEVSLLYVLPTLTPEGYNVTVTKYLDTDVKKFDHVRLLKATDVVQMLYFHRRGTCNGSVFVFDTEGMTFRHIWKINMPVLRKYLVYSQEGIHIRIKGVHILGVNFLVQKTISLLKPFLRSEIFEMLHFHKNVEELVKFVPRKMLPKDYGGEAPTFQEIRSESLALIEKFDEFLAQDDV